MYSLRHFYAVNALRNGIGVFEVARNMGTSVQMIQEYYGRQASTPPTNAPIDTTRRGFLGGTAAALVAGAAVNVAALATIRPAAAASDPIYAAIEAHKVAVVAGEVAHDRYSALEEELHRNGRLRKSDRMKDEARRGEQIEEELRQAHIAEGAAAIALLGADVTTLAGLMTLLAYVQRHDDDTYGEGWPDRMYDDTIEGTRCWHHYLVAKLAHDLPTILRETV